MVGFQRLRRTVAVVALAVMTTSLGVAAVSAPAQAVVKGNTPTPTPPWNAKISYIVNGTSGICSGALIAERWVLTAAHCAVFRGANNSVGSVFPASAFTVRIGKASLSEPGAFVTRVDQPPLVEPLTFNSTGQTSPTGWINDIALLHLSASAPSSLSPLPLRSSAAVVSTGSQVQLFGWGDTKSTAGSGQVLRTTRSGEWTFSDTCPGNGQVCYNHTGGATSYGAGGDSGGPWATYSRGGWIGVGTYSGDDQGLSGYQYGASIKGYLTWIRNRTGLPSVATNTIVRDSSTGTSWYYGSDGFMKWIPTGDIYNCLRSRGASLLNTSRYNALSVPQDLTANATCSTVPPPPPPTISISWSRSYPTWISMTVSGFTAGTYQYTCNFGSGGPHTYTVSLSGGTQTFDNGHTCYDGISGDTVWVTISSAVSNTVTVGSPSSSGQTCSYSDAGNGQLITTIAGSTFTDSRGISYRVNGDCSLTQVCFYTDAGNGQLITATAGASFSDSRGLIYFVNYDCTLTPA